MPADGIVGTWLTPNFFGSIKSMKYPKLDAKNPDTWSGGTLYGPERGREVSPKMVLTGADTLEIKVSAGLARKAISGRERSKVK